MRIKGKRILAIVCSLAILVSSITGLHLVQRVEAANSPDTSLKEITFSDFGIADGDYAGEYSFAVTEGTYSGTNLDGTLFNGNITYSESFQPEICFANGYTEEGLTNVKNRGLRIYRDTANPTKLFMYNYFPGAGFADCMSFDPTIAGTTLIGQEFNLKISVQFVGEDADNDGRKDDVKLGFWFDNVLYNNAYKELKGQAKYFGNKITIFNYYNADTSLNGPVTVESVQIQQPDEEDEGLKEITFRDFGIADGDYAGAYSFAVTEGTYNKASLDGTLFSGDVTFSEGFQPEICFGNGYTEEGLTNVKNRGLRIYRDTANPTKLFMYNYFPGAGFADCMSFDPTIAGTTLIGKEFNLKISVEFVGEDADNDGRKDDVKLGFWFDNVLYNNAYKELKGQAKYFGNKITIFNYYNADTSLNGPVTVKSVAIQQPDEDEGNDEVAELTEITFRDFGLADGNYAGAYSFDVTEGTYSGASLDGTLFSGDVMFSEGFQPEICFGNGYTEEGLTNVKNRGLRIYRDTQHPDRLYMYDYFPGGTATNVSFDPEVAGTTLIGEEFNLKISVQFVGEDADSDGRKDDVKLGIFFDDVLYNDAYIELKGQAKYFGNKITMFNYYNADTSLNGPVSIKSVGEQEPDEDEGGDEPEDLQEITFRDFDIADGEYAESYSILLAAEGTYEGGSLDGTIFNANVTFSEGFQPTICFGSGYTDGTSTYNWHGLRFYQDAAVDGALFMYNNLHAPSGHVSASFTPEKAETQLVGKKFNLKISVQFVDSDSDGNEDDIKLGVFFNDKLYENRYIYLVDQAPYLGNKITIWNTWDKEDVGAVTIESAGEWEEPPAIQPDDTLTKVTFGNFGIADGEYCQRPNSFSFGLSADGQYGESDLDGILFNGNVTFSKELTSYLCVAGTNGWYGLRLYNMSNGNLRLSAVTDGSNTDLSFEPVVITRQRAKTNLVGQEFNLKMAIQYMDFDGDGVNDDVRLGVWFNDVLYNNEYIEMHGYAKSLGNHLAVFCDSPEASVMVGSVDYVAQPGDGGSGHGGNTGDGQDSPEEETPEVLDPSLTKITFGHFGIADGEYTQVPLGDIFTFSAAGSYDAENLDGTVFQGKVKFSKSTTATLCLGGKESGWYGLRLSNAMGNSLRLVDSTGRPDGEFAGAKFTSKKAGVNLIDNEFNLKLSIQYVDLDGDGIKDDVKLGVWFNDVLYDNEYLYLTGYAEWLGNHLGIYCETETAKITVASVDYVAPPFDFAAYGLTKNWKKTLLDTGMSAKLPVGGSKTPEPFTGDVTDIMKIGGLVCMKMLGATVCAYVFYREKRKNMKE